jgi:hypothetical protein
LHFGSLESPFESAPNNPVAFERPQLDCLAGSGLPGEIGYPPEFVTVLN